MSNSPFLGEEDFFKSNVLNERGDLMTLVKSAGHKYVKRTGVSGNYKYWYRDSKGKLVARKDKTHDEKKGKSFKYSGEYAISVADLAKKAKMDGNDLIEDNRSMESIAREELEKLGKKKGFKIKKFSFVETDSGNASHAGAYFNVEVEGDEKAVKAEFGVDDEDESPTDNPTFKKGDKISEVDGEFEGTIVGPGEYDKEMKGTLYSVKTSTGEKFRSWSWNLKKKTK